MCYTQTPRTYSHSHPTVVSLYCWYLSYINSHASSPVLFTNFYCYAYSDTHQITIVQLSFIFIITHQTTSNIADTNVVVLDSPDYFNYHKLNSSCKLSQYIHLNSTKSTWIQKRFQEAIFLALRCFRSETVSQSETVEGGKNGFLNLSEFCGV